MRLCVPDTRLEINEMDARECRSLNLAKGQKHMAGALYAKNVDTLDN